MIGDLTQRQVLALAEQGASSTEIAETLEIEEAAVKLVLNANSAGSAQDRDINDEQLAILRQKAFQLAVGAEDESVSARMTMFLIERDKPRLKEQTISPFMQINNAIINGSARFDELARQYSGSIEIQSSAKPT